MGKIKDLTGMVFGRLTVLGATDKRSYGSVVWLCLCVCGNTALVISGNLRNGQKSCGCLNKELAAAWGKRSAKDITGNRYGKLVALNPTPQRQGRSIKWLCLCDCGNEILAVSSSLIRGITTSCGCKLKESISARFAKDITGNRYGRLVAVEPTCKRSGTSVVWKCQCDCGEITFVSNNRLQQGHTTSCKCLQKEKAASVGRKYGKRSHKSDLSGKRYGKLVVLESTDQIKNSCVVWKCQCDCGNIVDVTSANLSNKSTKSCGCLRSDDITNERFERLLVVKRTNERHRGSVVWECLCDCGNTKLAPLSGLRSGQIKSCGCYAKERLSEIHSKDLTGMRSGRLVALKPSTERTKGKNIIWECLCDCGNTSLVSSGALLSRGTRSCGCLWFKHDVVYLYAMLSHDLIKLGISRNPFNRMEALCEQLRVDVKLLAYTQSDYRQEKKLHQQFVAYRATHPNNPTGREWFYPSDEVMAAVRSMEFQLDNLPILA